MDLPSCARQNAANDELCSLRLIFAHAGIYHHLPPSTTIYHLFALALMRSTEVKTASCKSKFNVWPQKNQLLKCQRSGYNVHQCTRQSAVFCAGFKFISAFCQNFVSRSGRRRLKIKRVSFWVVAFLDLPQRLCPTLPNKKLADIIASCWFLLSLSRLVGRADFKSPGRDTGVPCHSLS